jgi:hypothetical protein
MPYIPLDETWIKLKPLTKHISLDSSVNKGGLKYPLRKRGDYCVPRRIRKTDYSWKLVDIMGPFIQVH